jgi:hypothetical protein
MVVPPTAALVPVLGRVGSSVAQLVTSVDCFPWVTSFTTFLIFLGKLLSKSCLNASKVWHTSSAKTRVSCDRSAPHLLAGRPLLDEQGPQV